MERPTDLPGWDANDTATTIPSGAQISDGYPINSTPTRQVLNYLFRLWSLWVQWFVQVLYEAGIFHPDHAWDGAAPTTGVIPADPDDVIGSFSARAVANGVLVPLTQAPSHTYGVTTDTYWDIDEDAVWTPVEVTALDPEPAVTADAVRVFRVRTNATNITAVQDRRAETARYRSLSLVGQTFRGWAESLNILLGFGTAAVDAQLIEPLEDWVLETSTGALYQLTHRFRGSSGSSAVRVYRRISGARKDEVVVWGAELTAAGGTGTWTARAATAKRVIIGEVEEKCQIRTGLTPDVTTWTDAAWETYQAGNTVRARKAIDHGIRFQGDRIFDTGLNANLVGNLEHMLGDAVRLLVDKGLLQDGSDMGMYEWLTTVGFATQGPAREFGYNCNYDEDADQWSRNAAGVAYLFVFGNDGLRVMAHSAADASPWNNTTGAGTWEYVARIQFESTTGGGVVVPTAAILTAMPGSPGINTIFRDSFMKVVARIHVEGNVATVIKGDNVIDAVISGSNLTINFDTPFLDDEYSCLATVLGSTDRWATVFSVDTDSAVVIANDLSQFVAGGSDNASEALVDFATATIDICFWATGGQ